ncbi:STAS domain-containing protein [Hyunsoonleella pacifica]|uniref:STAS domain-containing protein n=1 Tax=Hyunsoonleella pacifica TaxID=1080224 RepID=A0A4Q9FPC2_9FLAO|nr:STAS domain-containing protein [Hyunsoonleella pacifica]TBN15633.1 STAS domain-containing protein [Hyunsoonleella pacifica]GGD21415.1 hypothetical protein GCM10011368_24220 [Hyunsoonleella pacifica]
MELRITNCNNFFKLKGILNKDNVESFRLEFQEAFRKFDHLTISIEGLESVDRFGVDALADLHTESLKINKQLSIVGFGCKELYDHFKSFEAA